MRFRSHHLLAVPAVALLIAASGCGGEDDAGGGEAKAAGGKIKVGLNVELSGPGAFFGKSREIGAKTAVADINAAGGVKVGDETYELELVVCDNRTDPTQGVQCAQEGADADVLWTAAPDLGFEAAYQIYRDNDILSFGNGGVPGALLTNEPEKHPTLFFEFLTYQQTTESHLIQLKALFPEVKTIAALVPDDANGRELDKSYKTYSEKYGFTYVGAELHPPDATGDFTSYLTALKSKNPDHIWLGYYPQVVIPAAEQAKKLNATKVLGADLMLPEDLKDSDFKGLPFISYMPAWAFTDTIRPPDGSGDELIDKLNATAGGEPYLSAIATQAYISDVTLPAKALEEAGSLDVNAIAEKLMTAKYDGPLGPAEVTKNHSVDLAQNTVVWDAEGKATVKVFTRGFDEQPSEEFPVGE